MSIRTWRRISTIAGIALGGVLAAIYFGGLVDEYAQGKIVSCAQTHPKPGYTLDDQGYAFQSTRRWQTAPQTIDPIYKQIDCQNPQGSKDYESCQQWRSANAGAEQACIAGFQFWQSSLGTYISILGLVGLGATVLYTARAAQGAHRSAEIAERALVDLGRPQIFVDVKEPGVRLNATLPAARFETHGDFRYRFRNFGGTVAQLLHIKLDYPIVLKPGLPAPLDDESARVIPTGVVVSTEVPYEETENLHSGEVYGFGGLFDAPNTPRTHRLFFIGWFRFSDIFHKTYKVGFCFVFDPLGRRWVQIGDNTNYNYLRKEDAT